MAESLILQIQSDISDIQADYKQIEKLEQDRADQAKILTQQTLALRKKALKEEEAALRNMIKAQEEAGASNKEQFQKPIEESTNKIKDLQGQVDALTPATKKATVAQQELGKAAKRVSTALRGIAITAALAFGAAALKAVFDFAKGLFEGSRATQALNKAMEAYQKSAGEAVGKSKALFSELKAAAPGTKRHGELVAQINKEYGDIVRLSPQATIKEIANAEALVNNELLKQARLTAQRNALAEAFAQEETLRLNIISAKRQGVNDATIGLMEQVLAEIQASNSEIESTFNNATKAADVFKGVLTDTAGAATDLGRAVSGAVDEEATKKAQAAADAARKAIKANFDAGEKAIQALLDEITRAQIEAIDDEQKRAIENAEFDLQLAKRSAEETIQDKKQQDAFIELLEEQHQTRLQAIREKFATGGGVVIPPEKTPEGGLTLELNEFLAKQAANKAKREITDENNLALELLDIDNQRLTSKRDLIKGNGQEEIALRDDIDTQITENERQQAELRAQIQEGSRQSIIDGINATGDALTALGGAFQALSQIVGEETEAGAKLAKLAAIFEIAAAEAVAIANVVQMASNVGAVSGPAGPILFIATLVSGIATTVASIAKAKNILESEPLPTALAEGRSGGEGTMALVGERGREVVYIPEGAAVINNRAVMHEREMIEALNDGKIHEYLNRNYIYPAIIEAQERQKQQDAADMRDFLKGYMDAFDDERLHRDNVDQKQILKVIARRLKPAPSPAPRSRFGS